VTRDFRDPALFAEAARWLEECVAHDECQEQEPPFQPERVIDFGTGGSQTISLRAMTANGEELSYVALSYCWRKGRDQPEQLPTYFRR